MEIDDPALTDGYSPTQSTFLSEDQTVIEEAVLIVEKPTVEVLSSVQEKIIS